MKPHNVRVGEAIVKGYTAGDLHDPWIRYTPHLMPAASSTGSSPDPSATSATPLHEPPEPDSFEPFFERSETTGDTCGDYLSTDRDAFGKTQCVTCEQAGVTPEQPAQSTF